MRSPALPLVVAALLVAGTLPAASQAVWVPVRNPHELVCRQVAQFAVLMYSLARRADLRYVDVVRGATEEAVGGGTNYRLVVVAAAAGSAAAQYECLVWGVPGSRSDTWKLRRFRKIRS
ncbi:hypothetical protein ACP70R_012941 [Stipagrostis hirtigluma subsp. patula]